MMTFEQQIDQTSITIDLRYFLELHEKAVKYDILMRTALAQDFITDSERAIYNVKKEKNEHI